MDSEGNIFRNPSPELVKEKKLTEVKRQLTEREEKTQKIGRNSLCGCGSGVKFKKCCYEKFD